MSRLGAALSVLLRGQPLPDERPDSVSLLDILLGPFTTSRRINKRQQVQSYSGWVAACVNAISADVRTAAWELGELDADGEFEALDPREVPPIFTQPNGRQTFADVMEITSKHIDLMGEAFWYMTTQAGNPGGEVDFWEVIPAHLIDGPGYDESTQRFSGWRYQHPNRGILILPGEDVVFTYTPNPKDLYRGASAVEMAALSHDMDTYAKAYGTSILEGGGLPVGLITTEQQLSPDQATDIQERWRQSRTVGRSEVAVFGSGSSYQPLGVSIKDLEFLSLSRMNRDGVLSIFGVPAAKLGLVEDVNRANAEGVQLAYARDTLKPRLMRIQDSVNQRLLPRLGLEDLTFRFANVVPQDRAFDLQVANDGLKSGTMTVNEWRVSNGFEPLEGDDGEMFLIPSGFRLAEDHEPQPTPDFGGPPGDTEEDSGVAANAAGRAAPVIVINPLERPTGASRDSTGLPAPSIGEIEATVQRVITQREVARWMREQNAVPVPAEVPVEVTGERASSPDSNNHDNASSDALARLLGDFDWHNGDSVDLVKALQLRGFAPEDLALSERDREHAHIRFELRQTKLERAYLSTIRALLERERKQVVKQIKSLKNPPQISKRLEVRPWVADVWERHLVDPPRAEQVISMRLREFDIDDYMRRDLLDRVFESQKKSSIREMARLNMRATEDGWDLFSKDVGREVFDFQVFESEAGRASKTRAEETWEQVHETSRRAIAQTVADGVEAGLSVALIADSVGRLYDQWKGPRAQTVASTESATMINFGHDGQATTVENRLQNTRVRNTWVTNLDGRERDAHRDANGQRQWNGAKFKVGGEELRRPLDPNGSASNVINCRCILVSEIVERE